MTDIMFEIPSNPSIEKCIITKETVQKKEKPEVVINEQKKAKDKAAINKIKTKQKESA